VDISLPKTRAGWIALAVVSAVVIVFLFFFTKVFQGHAVEVSVQNASTNDIFAHIDSTGRHGEGTETTALTTSNHSTTPPGLRVPAGTTRSFGFAVGFFDSPTLHIWPISEHDVADPSKVQDCVFDTLSFKKLEIPSTHVLIKWSDTGCERPG
jgi:hypothetical protein